jgi:hypothetical protein
VQLRYYCALLFTTASYHNHGVTTLRITTLLRPSLAVSITCFQSIAHCSNGACVDPAHTCIAVLVFLQSVLTYAGRAKQQATAATSEEDLLMQVVLVMGDNYIVCTRVVY